MAQRSVFSAMSMEDIVSLVSRWIFDVVLTVSLALFLYSAVGTQVIMDGSAMLPTIESGDTLLVNRFSGRLVPIERFDIIVYRIGGSGKTYLKRVLALPGETIEIRNGTVYIDGEELESELLQPLNAAGLASEPVVMGEGEFFVVGDSADASLDSRFADVGNITSDSILGTVWFRLKPFRSLGPMR